MKKRNRALAMFFLLLSTVFCLASSSQAQESVTSLPDGIKVAFYLQRLPEPKPEDVQGISSGTMNFKSETKLVSREFADHKSKIYFGYDLLVTAIPNTNKYRISVKNLAGPPHDTIGYMSLVSAAMPKLPEDMIVEDGDIIALDLLENPRTKQKIRDLIKITREVKQYGGYFNELKRPRDFSIDDIGFRLSGITHLRDDKMIFRGGASLSGKLIYFYFPGIGRFIMSMSPQKGFNFQKIGIVDQNKIEFTFKGQKYTFTSNLPILCDPGVYNLWVMHDTNYKSDYKFSSDMSFEFGSAENIQTLMKSGDTKRTVIDFKYEEPNKDKPEEK